MNATEQMVKTMLEQRGFRVLRNGWPDFLCIRKHVKQQGGYFDGNPAMTEVLGLMAVEVKGSKDKLSESQLEVHKALRAVRIPVYVVRTPLDGENGFRTRHSLTSGEISHFTDSVTKARTKAKALQTEIDRLQSQLAELNAQMDSAAGVIGDAQAVLEETHNKPSDPLAEHEEVKGWVIPGET